MTWGGLADCGGICPGISKQRRSGSCGKERTAFQSVGLTEAGVPTQGSWGVPGTEGQFLEERGDEGGPLREGK